MKKLISIFALACAILLNQNLFAATGQYALSYRDDPASTIVVGWSGDNATVYYGTSDFGQDYLQYPNSKTVDRTGNAHGHNRKFARLSNLQANTMYYFVIRDVNGQVSARFKFRTLSDNPNDPVSYITGGDSRDGFKAFGAYIENCPSGNCLEMRREGNRLVAKIRPDFIAFNGDYVMNQITSNSTNEWNEWFNDWQLTISSDGRMYPTLHTQGNHEDNSDMFHMFDVPEVEYYSVNINNGLIRMYLLNSELNACSNTTQLNWLINDFQNHTTGGSSDPYWKFVQYHIPTFAMGNGYGLVADQMSCWVNLFQQFKVRLVSESHTHITKWTLPCKSNSGGTDFEVDMENGIVYIGEGQWGAPHRTLDFVGANKKPYVRDQEVFDNFFFIRVTANQTSIKSVKFENAANVVASTNDELGGTLPSGVVLWNPANGNEVLLNNTIVEPSSVKNLNKTMLNVSPNPSENSALIQFSTFQNNVTIELYNSLGKLCTSEKVSGNTYNANLENVCSGVNYIYLKTEDGKIESIKIIKK